MGGLRKSSTYTLGIAEWAKRDNNVSKETKIGHPERPHYIGGNDALRVRCFGWNSVILVCVRLLFGNRTDEDR